MVHSRSAVHAALTVLARPTRFDRKGWECQRQHGWRSFRRYMTRVGDFSQDIAHLEVVVRSGGTDRPPPMSSLAL